MKGSGPWTGKCRGGPYHGKIMTENKPFPVAKLGQYKFAPHDQPLPAYSKFEYHRYIPVENPETVRMEWIWEPHLKKLRKRWDKKKEIESIMRRFAGRAVVEGDGNAERDVKRVLELVYKL